MSNQLDRETIQSVLDGTEIGRFKLSDGEIDELIYRCLVWLDAIGHDPRPGSPAAGVLSVLERGFHRPGTRKVI